MPGTRARRNLRLLGRARDRWLAIDAPEAGDAQQAKEQLATVVDGSDYRVATGISWVTPHAPRAAGRTPVLGAPHCPMPPLQGDARNERSSPLLRELVCNVVG